MVEADELDRRSTLARSFRLLAAFRVEQSDPDRFYTALAEDSAGMVGCFTSLAGAAVLDVGGGPGYFSDAFEHRGAHYVPLDADVGEMSARGQLASGSVIGSGTQLPFFDGSFDVTFSSNVLEHVAEPWKMADEMVRVTRSGGVVVLSYTLWWGPWGGHETAPWHYLGGHRAADRYRRRHGRDPKNLFGESLFPITARSGLRWAHSTEQADLVRAFPRYAPSFAQGLVRLPGLREVLAWNLVLVLRRR
jgi:SAM-dependent methyltransferase